MVLVLTVDARTLVGKLLSCDQMTNLVSDLDLLFIQSPRLARRSEGFYVLLT